MVKIKRRILSLILSLAMIITLVPMMETVEVKATNKSALDAVSWCKSQLGKSLDYDGIYGAQCADFIKYYYQYLGVSPTNGNGCDYAWNNLPSGWTRVQGGIPQKGDILVYSGNDSNKYGHVAIYESDYSTYHQNFHGQYVENITGIKYNGFKNPYWGYIRPNWANKPPVNKPTYCNVLLNETEFKQDGKLILTTQSNNSPTKYTYKILKYNGVVKTYESTASSLTIPISDLDNTSYPGPGNYEVYVIAENSAGSLKSSRASFKYVKAPTTCVTTLNKYSFDLDETINISMEKDVETFGQPSQYEINIYDYDNNKVNTLITSNNSIALDANILGIGQYKYIVKASNVAGTVYSDYISFSILDLDDKLNTTDPNYISNLNNPLKDGNNIIYDRICFGNYQQSDINGIDKEPIKWRVLEVNGDDVLLWSDQVLDMGRVWTGNYESGAHAWDTSLIRTWLNSEFFNAAFNISEKAAIKTTNVTAEKGPATWENGSDTTDKIYLLSYNDVHNEKYGISTSWGSTKSTVYTPYALNKMKILEEQSQYSTSYSIWTRTVDNWGYNFAHTSYYTQHGEGAGQENYAGIRPAMHINLSMTKKWKYVDTVKLSPQEELVECYDRFTSNEEVTTPKPIETTTKQEITTKNQEETTTKTEYTTTANKYPIEVKGLTITSIVDGNVVSFTWSETNEQIESGQTYNVYYDGELFGNFNSSKVLTNTFKENGMHLITVKSVLNGIETEGQTAVVQTQAKETTTVKVDSTAKEEIATAKNATKPTTQSIITKYVLKSVPKPKIKKAINVKGKKVKLKWNDVSKWYFNLESRKNMKFEIQYATNKSFTKGKKTKKLDWTRENCTVKKLKKGKTYYFRIRSYVEYYNDNTRKSYSKKYSSWSNVKKVKIKK